MLFRRRFFLAAAMAAAIGLVGPPTARAGFSLTLASSDAGVGSGTVQDNSSAVINGKTYVDGDVDDSTMYVASGSTRLYNGVNFSIASQTNAPGTEIGQILSTSLWITNTTNTTRNIQFIFTSDGFTNPSSPGETLFLMNRLTALSGTVLPGSNFDVYTAAKDQNGNIIRTNNYTSAQYGASPFTEVFSDQVTFTRGNTYTLYNMMNLTLAAGQTIQLTSESLVVAPAPPGLILAATALPFVGLIRRRLKKESPAA